MPALIPFPGMICKAIESLDAKLEVKGSVLYVTYHLLGDIDAIKLPKVAPAHPADGLWKHTCFELFYRPAGAENYEEFNFSPSGAWNHYTFTAYRATDEAAPKTEPKISLIRKPRELMMLVQLPAPPQLTKDADMVASLTAVIEDMNGHITYWATAHTNTEPDFHHPDSFIIGLELT